MRRFPFPLGDVLASLLCAATIAGALVWTAGGAEGVLYVEVEASGEKHLYPLDENREIHVEGPVGKTDITIMERYAQVTHSDCREKICIAMGDIAVPGAWLACLPNRVFVRVVAAGGDEGEIDAAAF